MRFILILLASVSLLQAATFNSDGTLEDVQLIHDDVGTVAGDIITIPSGSRAWSGQLAITKAITLQGLGSITLDGNSRATNCAAIIEDDRSSGSLITIELAANATTRITGIKFFGGGNRTAGNVGGIISVNGLNTDNRRFRMDHCVFDECIISALAPHTVLGVVDHCTIESSNQIPCAYVKNESWNGTQGVDSFGDGTYDDPDDFGTDKFLFFENNNLTCTWGAGHVTMIDGNYGARWVARYNTITQGNMEGHGASSDRARSTRAVEVYNNTFIGNSGGSNWVYARGGVWIVHGNTISGYYTAPLNLLTDRIDEPGWAPIGGADGRNPWDINNPAILTGTVTTATATVVADVSFSISDSGQSMTTNAHAGAILRKTSGKTVSSLTRSGSLGTVVVSGGHGLTQGTRLVYQIPSGGTGYTNGDTLTVSGGTGTATTLTATVSGGVVTSLAVAGAGAYTTLPATEFSGTASTTGGTGSGCTVKLEYTHPPYSLWGADQYAWNYRFSATTLVDANTIEQFLPWPTTTPATGTIKFCKGNQYAAIISNTATQIVYKASLFYAVSPLFHMTFEVGDTFEINRVTLAMDMVGVNGMGTLTGTPPTLPGGGNSQSVSACYEWNNTYEAGGNAQFSTTFGSGDTIQSGTHYFNDTTKIGYATYTYPHPLTSELPRLRAQP
jgi:hypothetical protein